LERGSRRSFGRSLVGNGAAGNARELAGVSSRRRALGGRVTGERGEAERSGRVHSARGDAWTSCTRRELTSGTRNGVRMTNVAVVLPPVGHVGELHFDSEETMSV